MVIGSEFCSQFSEIVDLSVADDALSVVGQNGLVAAATSTMDSRVWP